MIAPPPLAALFPAPDHVLFYRGTFQGKPFLRQWTRLHSADETGFVIRCVVELDLAVITGAGGMVYGDSELVLDRDLAPQRYVTVSQGSGFLLELRGDAVEVRMPDGSRREFPRGGAGFIVEANQVGLDALALAVAHARGQTALTLFLVNQLLVVPYRLTPVTGEGPGIHLETSHDEELHLDADGVLERVKQRRQPIEMERAPAPPLPERSQAPKPEIVRYTPPAGATFRLEDVSIPAGDAPIGGTLTVPRGSGPFPAVLFLSGTGSHDRHGITGGQVDLGSHEIVDDLAEHGIAGLRCDTRGAGSTRLGADPMSSRLEPIIEDARACLAWLRARPEVDPARIAIVGHSQGGTVALVLAREARPRAVVLLAAPGRPIDEILVEQIVDKGRKLGVPEDQVDKQVGELRELVALVRAGREIAPGQVPDVLIPLARTSDWLAEHLRLDPGALAGELTCPLLVCQGAKDFQVSVRDADRLAAAATAGGVDVTRELFPGLDHLFKPVAGEESTLAQYYDRTRHVDPAFLARLRGWLEQKVGG